MRSARLTALALTALIVLSGVNACQGTPAASAPPSNVRLGATAADEAIQLTVTLNLRDEADLAGFLARLNDPASPDYQQYLTAAQFGTRFGLPGDDVDRVVAWLEAGGLSAQAVPQRTSIAASGPARAVNRLLGVNLEDWVTPGGRRFHRAAAAPHIPADLRPAVAAISGLDTEPVVRPAFGGIVAAGVPAGGLLPQTVARAYEIEALHAAGLHGEGQTVAIVSFDTFTASDVDRFDQREALDAPAVEIVRLPGATERPGEDTLEVALDIQVIRGIAPQAQIINYEGPNGPSGFAALMARIVADGRAQIVSISWGLCEKYSLPTAIVAEEREFAAAFAAGISIFVASGDDGAYGCRRVSGVADDPRERDLSQDTFWPATSQSVIGVGGTFLSVREDGTYIDEAGWEEPLAGGGTGGGLSTVIVRPDWQAGAGVDNAFSNGRRQVPDVAGPADPSSGFHVIYTDADGEYAGAIGGTSAAAPFWAASMVLTQQLAAADGIDGLGSLGPTLYQIAAEQPPGAVFHDIIRGGNLLFRAGPGWDYATGLGTPRVAPLAQAIVDFLKRPE